MPKKPSSVIPFRKFSKGSKKAAMQWQCCFCAESLKNDEVNHLILLVEYPNMDGMNESPQEIHCHGGCLQKAVHTSVPILVE